MRPDHETDEVYLETPFPPSVNTYWRRKGNQGYLSAAGKAFRELVAIAVHEWSVGHVSGRLDVQIVLHRGDRRSFDVDNFFKGLLDGLQNSGVYDNDGQIDNLAVKRGEVLETAKATVLIKRMSAGPASVIGS